MRSCNGPRVIKRKKHLRIVTFFAFTGLSGHESLSFSEQLSVSPAERFGLTSLSSRQAEAFQPKNESEFKPKQTP
jgi:hypothetical protein